MKAYYFIQTSKQIKLYSSIYYILAQELNNTEKKL